MTSQRNETALARRQRLRERQRQQLAAIEAYDKAFAALAAAEEALAIAARDTVMAWGGVGAAATALEIGEGQLRRQLRAADRDEDQEVAT